MALAARDSADRASQLLAITFRLTELVDQEIEAAKSGHIDSSSQQWAEKEKLAHAYRLEMVRIGKDPSLLSGISPGVKVRLQEAVEAFRLRLAIHADALLAVRDVTEAMVRSVCEEVSASRAAPASYGSDGVARSAKGGGIALDARA